MNRISMIDKNTCISALALVSVFLLMIGTDPMESPVFVLLALPMLIGLLVYGFTNTVIRLCSKYGIGTGAKSLSTVGSMMVFMLVSIGIFGQLKTQDISLIVLFFIGVGFYIYRRYLTRPE